MDPELFLQQLRDQPLEEGRTYIQTHVAELADHAAIGNLIKDEALRQQNIRPFVSLKLAELLIFFSDYVHHPTSHALGLIAKGDALRCIGHHQAALEYLDAAAEEFLRLKDEVGWARSRIGWILSAAWLSHTEEALQEATRARNVFLQHKEYTRACTVDHNTAIVYSRLGRYQEAIALYERMRALYPTLTDQSESFIKHAIALAENNQASNLFWLGNFEQAYHLMQQAQASFIALRELHFIFMTEENLAEYDYAQGYYGSALRRYYQVYDSLIQNNIDDPIMLADLKQRIADCLVKLNKTQEACQLVAEAVKTYRQAGQSLDTAAALYDYATTLVASGRLKEALAALDEAWDLFNQGGFDHYAFATKLQRAELQLEMGDFTEAYEQAHLTKEFFETKALAPYAVRASLVMVGSLIENAQEVGTYQEKEQRSTLLKEAVSLCRQAALRAHQHNLQEQVYKSQYLLGRLALAQDNPMKAAKHYGAAIIQIERILDNLVYDLSPSFLHTAWSVYADMIALCLQQSQVESAFAYLEQARSMALRQYLNKSSTSWGKQEEKDDPALSSILHANAGLVLRTQHELKDWQERYRDYTILLTDIDASGSPIIDRETIKAELTRCEAKISELFERLHLYQIDTHLAFQTKKRSPRDSKRQGQQLDIAQLHKHLSPDQLLLAYYIHKSKLVIFAITAEGIITHENPEGAAQLERLLPLLFAHLRPEGWPNPQQPPQEVIRRLSKKLYDLLVAPVASLLPCPSGFLTIVPYGPLHKLPFHALYNGTHFLVEDFQINYLPASSLLINLGTLNGRHAAHPLSNGYDSEPNLVEASPLDKEQSIRSPLVFGYSGNGYLSRALDEAKTVAALLDGHCYLEEQATIAKLIEQAPGSPIIHLATHGQSKLDAPNFSYVRLADGHLNAIDAFSLDLKNCELVTLSGCETGLAQIGGGDEQLGLGRAFLAAGAASLVMSLWPVEDNATNELMQLFYQHLLRGDSKVQALRAAQCSLLHRESSIYTHPYFWAAFRFVGEVDSLKYKTTKD